VINLVEGVSIWGVPGLKMDSFVHEERTFDHHLPACGKVDQSEAVFICTLMQTVFAYIVPVSLPNKPHSKKQIKKKKIC
jgi:hypothetical protein